MTSVADNCDRGLDIEDESFRQWSLEPVAADRDYRDDWYDLVATDSFDVASQSVDAGDPLECKSCWVRYDSRQRRGQCWWISRANHERLVNAGGQYILSVIDPDTEFIVRMSLVAASIVDGTQWNCGRGGQTVTSTTAPRVAIGALGEGNKITVKNSHVQSRLSHGSVMRISGDALMNIKDSTIDIEYYTIDDTDNLGGWFRFVDNEDLVSSGHFRDPNGQANDYRKGGTSRCRKFN